MKGNRDRPMLGPEQVREGAGTGSCWDRDRFLKGVGTCPTGTGLRPSRAGKEGMPDLGAAGKA